MDRRGVCTMDRRSGALLYAHVLLLWQLSYDYEQCCMQKTVLYERFIQHSRRLQQLKQCAKLVA